MAIDSSVMRARFRRTGVEQSEFSHDPLVQFRRWFADWCDTSPVEPTAAVLATVDDAGHPGARVMSTLVRDDDVVVFTDVRSRKAGGLGEGRRASVCFPWLTLARQVRIEGATQLLPDADLDAFFAARPRATQLLAWCSDQRSEVAERATVEREYQATDLRFGARPVPRPEEWVGFALVPDAVEFWQARSDLVHDRLRYLRDRDTWTLHRFRP